MACWCLYSRGVARGAAGQPFLAGAIAGLTAYAAETAASVWGNVNPPKASDAEAATDPATILNPVPTE